MRAIAIAALVVLTSALAHGQAGDAAAPSFEILDRGDAVEVIAHHVKAARTAVLPLRQRLQVPIAGAPAPKRITPSDPTVKLVEFDSEDATRVLSVKLSFERNDVRTLSRYAQAIQVGDDLHVIVPRKLPTDGVAPKLPEPTLSPAAAAAVAKADLKPPIALGPTAPPPAPSKPPVIPSIAPQLGPIAPPAPARPTEARPAEPSKPAEAARPPEPLKVEPLKVEVEKPAPVKPVKPAEPARPADEPHERVFGPQPDPLAHLARPADKKPEAAGTTRPGKPDDKRLGQTLAPTTETSWASAVLYIVLGAAALAAGVWHLRRKRGIAPANASIEILAQRSLGGKARLVWLTAGPHEMLVAVTAQQINLLGQWPRDGAVHLPTTATFAETMAASIPPAPEPAPGRFGFGPASAYAAAAARPDQDKPKAKAKATSQPLPPLPSLRAKRPSMARDAAIDVDVEHEPIKPPIKQVSRPLPVAKQVASLVEDRAARPSRPAIVLPPTPAAEPVRPRRPSVRAKTTIEAPPPRPPPAVVSDDRDGELDAMLAAVASAKPADKPHSPAVDGILRLRQSGKPAIIDAEAEEHNGGPLDDGDVKPTGVAAFPDDEDDDDDDDAPPPPRRTLTVEEEHAGGPLEEDEENADPEANQAWIKDILAATGANR